MCGIVGVISTEGNQKWPSDRSKFLRQGLVVDTLRGFDSTGIFTVEKGKEKMTAAWLKSPSVAAEFIQGKKFNAALKDVEKLWAMVGHNRAATQGTVKTANAHPFQEGAITLVHNGTLTSTTSMPLPEHKLTKTKGVEVDSHVIAHNLAVEPIEEWYKHMHGAWALVWHDARDGSINMVRNANRPLTLAKVKDQNTLLICSEADMLSFLARRISITIDSMYTIKENYHFKWLPEAQVMEPLVKELPRWQYTYNTYKRSVYDDDYPDWWAAQKAVNDAATGSRRSAAQSVPFGDADNTLVLAGKKREIPQQHQIDLMEYELAVEDRLPFKPWNVIPGKATGKQVVAGWLEEADMPCLVYGVPSAIVSDDFLGRRPWTVRPIGVHLVDTDPNAEPDANDDIAEYILCQFVRAYYTEPRPTTPTRQAGPSKGKTALGPKGIRLELDTFYKMVTDGCVKCRRVLSWLDDEDMSWTEDNKPICPACTAQEKRISKDAH